MDIKKAKRLEQELCNIDRQINALKAKRQEMIQKHEWYDGYVVWYAGYYDDEPESPLGYYNLCEEHRIISHEIQHAGDNVEAVYKKHGTRLIYLERRLAA